MAFPAASDDRLADREAVPVTLLTGFLGSGKTTLLNRLLADPRGRGAAVLINEFGEVGLDHLLARSVEGTKVVVRNGCVCCTMHEDLRVTLRGLLDARDRGDIPRFDRVLIETSGLSDPMPVMLTLGGDPLFRDRLRLRGIVTTVDGLNGLAQISDRETVLNQIAAADRLVITKTDLADPVDLAALEQRLGRIAPEAECIRMPCCPDPWEALMRPLAPWRLGARTAVTGKALSSTPLHRDDTGVRSFSLTFAEQPDWTRFAVWLSLLMHRHGRRLLRVKGLLDIAGHPGPMVLHAVQNFIHPPEHLGEWPDADHRSRLVFITDGLEEAEVRDALAAVLGLRSARPIETSQGD